MGELWDSRSATPVAGRKQKQNQKHTVTGRTQKKKQFTSAEAAEDKIYSIVAVIGAFSLIVFLYPIDEEKKNVLIGVILLAFLSLLLG